MLQPTFEFIALTDPRFPLAEELRWAILRGPLGIALAPDSTDAELGVSHLIAEIDGQVVGYGRLIERAGAAQIRQVVVAPDARGQGVGAGVVSRLVARATDSGAKVVWLNARITALDFYRKLGFFEVGDVFESAETSLPHMKMEYRS